MSNEVQERHPFRFLIKFLVIAGVLAAITRVMASKRAEYVGLSDSEAKAKFEEQLGPWIGDERAADIAEQVVPKLKDAGVFDANPTEKAMDNVKDAAGKTADAVKDSAKKASTSAKKAADSVADAAETASDAIGDAVGEAVGKIEEVSKKTRGR